MKRVMWIVMTMVLILSACGGGKTVPDVGDFSVPTVVPTSVPTTEVTTTAQPNILEVVRAQAEVRARIEAEVLADGEIRMSAEQFQAWQSEANRHTEEVQETTAKSLVDLGVVFAVAEGADDVSRNWGGAIAVGMAIGCIFFLFWLMKTGGGGSDQTEGKEGGG